MTLLVRTQLMLRDDQRDELNLIAQSEDSSPSEVVRQFVDAQLRQHRYDQMRDPLPNSNLITGRVAACI